MTRKTRRVTEFGDFQTPPELAEAVCRLAARKRCRPVSVVEPTCGTGTFLAAALAAFPGARRLVGLEIDATHVAAARRRLDGRARAERVRLVEGDFFTADWVELLDGLPEPLLVIGNPPWVTSAALGALGSRNRPARGCPDELAGLDAVTGKSNFDISEAILRRLLALFANREAVLVVLCKSAVARKVLAHAWREELPVRGASLHALDARKWFGAATSACAFSLRTGRRAGPCEAREYASLDARRAERILGWRDGGLVADVNAYDRWRHLGGGTGAAWRSGVKHDAARVMELRLVDGRLVNGHGEPVDVEDEHLFPLLKSADLAREPAARPTRALIVPQRVLGDNTANLRTSAPRTWRYLVHHGERLDRRASSIYRGRPRFSIFGVGDYTFAPWKVAISGLAKKLCFRAIGPVGGKPVVFDDTTYFLPCRNRREAEARAALLASEPARAFFAALVFRDNKRPVTREILARLDLEKLGEAVGG